MRITKVTYKGIARGRSIELDEPLPFSEGQPLRVSVEALPLEQTPGSPTLILQAMKEAPRLEQGDVEELERAIEHGRLPVRRAGPFDAPG